MPAIVNIAAYRFVSLDRLPERQRAVQERAAVAGLKGTVLLAEEGINLFLAGERAAIDGWLDWLRTDPLFAGLLDDLEVKVSTSEGVPFRKLLVKIKREIIRMDHPAIRPAAGRAPSVDAQTAARWLQQGRDDAGREVVMLDTRNAFEVDEGTFAGAIDWRIDKFTQFPAAVQAHRAELEGKTVVSFCTGGIRCEKAAIYMADEGIEHVYQLEGGILKYFEETGGIGFNGTCFVFDERRTLDAGLQPQPCSAGVASAEGSTAVSTAASAAAGNEASTAAGTAADTAVSTAAGTAADTAASAAAGTMARAASPTAAPVANG